MRKVYEKPYFEVVEYVGDYGYASSNTSTCLYLTCLIGGQNSEGISGLTIYRFVYNDTTYYVWYYDYKNGVGGSGGYTLENAITVSDFSSNNTSGTGGWYQDFINYVVENYVNNGSSTEGPLWHIATDSDGTFNAS